MAPAYSKVRYRGSTFRSFVRLSAQTVVYLGGYKFGQLDTEVFIFRPSVHNLCQGAYSVAVIAGSMKPCIVITLDTHFKKAP